MVIIHHWVLPSGCRQLLLQFHSPKVIYTFTSLGFSWTRPFVWAAPCPLNPVVHGAISNQCPQIGILFLPDGLYESHPVGGLWGDTVFLEEGVLSIHLNIANGYEKESKKATIQHRLNYLKRLEKQRSEDTIIRQATRYSRLLGVQYSTASTVQYSQRTVKVYFKGHPRTAWHLCRLWSIN